MNIRKMKKKGISPVIASIILIAITVAVAIAVAGWVFGLFGTYGTAGGVTITVTSLDTDVTNPGNPNIYYTVINSKPTSITISSIRIQGDFASVNPNQVIGAATTVATSATLTGSSDLTAGMDYTIQFILSDGTILTSVAKAS